MRQGHPLIGAAFVQLGLMVLATGPAVGQSQPEQSGRIAAFLADTEGKQEEAKLPIIIELLQRGEMVGADSVAQVLTIEPSTEFAIVMLGRLGKKEHAGLLAP